MPTEDDYKVLSKTLTGWSNTYIGNDAYTMKNFFNMGFKLVGTGYLNNGIGSAGHYWTQTTIDNVRAHVFSISSNSLSLNAENLREERIPVRCVRDK